MSTDIVIHMKRNSHWIVPNDLTLADLDISIGIFNIYCTQIGERNVWSIQFGRSGGGGNSYMYRLQIRSARYGGDLVLRLEYRSAMHSEKVLKDHNINFVQKSGFIVPVPLGRLLWIIKAEGLESFKFIGGRGQRYWIYIFLCKLYDRGLIYQREQVLEARLTMAKRYPTMDGAAIISDPIVDGRFT